PEDETERALGLLVSLLQAPGDQPLELDEETREWLEADLGGPLPPYEWGSEGPPKGKPVHYVPGVGLIVEGGKDVAS
ncbi:MAG: hypothetical protein ACLGIN_02995, partial [Candidatus Sericytochromatia bacterium]